MATTTETRAFDAAVEQLNAALRPYDELTNDVHRLVSGWQKLTPDIRRVVGNLAPELVDAVLSIEDRRRA